MEPFKMTIPESIIRRVPRGWIRRVNFRQFMLRELARFHILDEMALLRAFEKSSSRLAVGWLEALGDPDSGRHPIRQQLRIGVAKMAAAGLEITARDSDLPAGVRPCEYLERGELCTVPATGANPVGSDAEIFQCTAHGPTECERDGCERSAVGHCGARHIGWCRRPVCFDHLTAGCCEDHDALYLRGFREPGEPR